MPPKFFTLLVMIAGACLIAFYPANGEQAKSQSSAAILQELKSFAELGTVLHVAAHPDDENTQLITYLARGRGCRVAYLSVTRGDGGQNVIGPEFGDELGVIRTQELLAARRLDGGQQFFTRAKDFGFSRDYLDTIKKWDRDQIVSDIVRIIRFFRPDVIVNQFSPQPGGTHGHHTASSVLSLEAFPLAGDPKAYPEQLKDLTVWQPKRLVIGGGKGGGVGGKGLSLDIVGGDDPVLGMSFGEIASRSRGMHRSQFGVGGGFGGGKGGGAAGPKQFTFSLLRGEPAQKDIFEGVETTWKRYKGGEEIAKLTEKAIADFNGDNPSASVPAILAIRKLVTALPKDPLVNEKCRQLDHVLQSCLRIEVKTALKSAEVVPGEVMELRHDVTHMSAKFIKWVGVRYPSIQSEEKENNNLVLTSSSTPQFMMRTKRTLPSNSLLSQAYWLRKDGTLGMAEVDNPSLIGLAENPPAFPVEFVFNIDGQELVVADEPVQIIDNGKTKTRRRMEVIAPVTLTFEFDVKLFAPGATRNVDVRVTAFRPDTTGTVELDVPVGWKVEQQSQPFSLKTVGDNATTSFKVTAPAKAAEARISARAKIKGATYDTGRVEIKYDHIPFQLLQPAARTKGVALDLAIRGKKIGYIPGAGDSVAECVEQMGYEVVKLTGSELTPEKLKNFDAVIVGVRALNVRNDLGPKMQNIFDYAKGGGTVIMQYNRQNPKVDKFAPYSLNISGDRVTDEEAPMTILVPDHPVFNTPNKITQADFDGWVQERGLYFPSQWGKEFIPLLACNDPGMAPMKGSLLVARHGEGHYVYTGLAWFRQLPAGVPGAYRLFANIVSLGKK